MRKYTLLQIILCSAVKLFRGKKKDATIGEVISVCTIKVRFNSIRRKKM